MKKKINVIVLFLLCCSQAVSAACDFEQTPLIRSDNCSWYMKEDKALNSAYKKLSKLLNKDNLTFLKKTQREWIVWRDTRCDAEQEKVICGNSFCDGVAHDHCIIYLTEQRANELRQFIKTPQDAAKRNFEFSRNNKYLDDE